MPGSVAAYRGQKRSRVSRKWPVLDITITLLNMAGITTTTIAAFRPIAETRNGKAHDEYPRPVVPLTTPAKKRPRAASARYAQSIRKILLTDLTAQPSSL